jgi:hypothetical protein
MPLNLRANRVDQCCVDASAYAFVQGMRSTRAALSEWNRHPWRVLRWWLAGSLVAALVLLGAVWVIGKLAYGPDWVSLDVPPFVTGGPGDVLGILEHNLLVLALHAMACVAGFIAGSSLPIQADGHRGVVRAIHEHGGRIAIAFVAGATIFSLSAQAMVLGLSVAHVSYDIHTTPGLLLLALLPHAIPELVALFLPLAAWIIASRRGEWDQLLAATVVTVAVALPVLIVTALWEVYVAPHVLRAVLG